MTREEAINEIKSWDFLEGKEIEAIHTLIPELKESEDERIRKRLINLIKELATSKVPILTGGYFVDGQDKKYIAWLEKQKEHTDTKQERVIKAARRVLNNWLDGTDCPDVSGDFTELEHAICGFDGEEKQKEQKFTHHETGESLQSAVTRQMEDDGDVDDFVRRGIDDIALRYAELGANWQKEQKPAEWSEEDEEHREWILECLADGKRKVPEFAEQYQAAFDWLKSLRPQGSKDSLQTHWKPSEEQMYSLGTVVKGAGDVSVGSVGYNLQTLYEQLKKLM